MAVTGNVKISELETHAYDLINGTEMFPISFGDTPNTYESYKMYLKDIANFTGSYLGVTDISEAIDENSGDISYIKRDFGQYAGTNGTVVTETGLSVAYASAYIYKDGTVGSNSNWSISSPIEVKKGMMYLLELNATQSYIQDGYCLFAKRRENNRVVNSGTNTQSISIKYPDGTVKTINIEVPKYTDKTSYVVYEPCSFHYATDGAPGSKFVVFVADEDAQIVCSAYNGDINNKTLKGVRYGVVSEAAEKYISNESYLGISIAEAIASLDARITGLEQRKADYDMPTYMGAPIICLSDHDPCFDDYYVDEWGSYLGPVNGSPTPLSSYAKGPDQPGFVGQLWVNKHNHNIWISVYPSCYGGNGWAKIQTQEP